MATQSGKNVYLTVTKESGNSIVLLFKMISTRAASGLYRAITETHAFYRHVPQLTSAKVHPQLWGLQVAVRLPQFLVVVCQSPCTKFKKSAALGHFTSPVAEEILASSSTFSHRKGMCITTDSLPQLTSQYLLTALPSLHPLPSHPHPTLVVLPFALSQQDDLSPLLSGRAVLLNPHYIIRIFNNNFDTLISEGD